MIKFSPNDAQFFDELGVVLFDLIGDKDM